MDLFMKIAQTRDRNAASRAQVTGQKRRASRTVPVETQAAPAWCLPGGVRLAEYMIRSGFVATSLLTRGERER